MGRQLIETIEVGSGGAASIEFTSIPQDGVDLVFKISARTDYSNTYDNGGKFSINSDTSSDYTRLFLRTILGTTVQTNGATNPSARELNYNGNNATANTFGNAELFIANYTSTSDKSISLDLVTENNATDGGITYIGAYLYPTSSAVTSVELVLQSGRNFLQYSTASLYKITAD